MRATILHLLYFALLFVGSRSEHSNRSGPLLPQCEWQGRSGSCVGIAGHPLTIPCGNHTQESGVEFFYSQQEGSTPLFQVISQQTGFLVVNVSRKDHNRFMRCTTNVSSEEYLYKLNITYLDKPTRIQVNIQQPLLGLPFKLGCPIDANPPASYKWIAYTNIDKSRRHDLPMGLIYLSEDHRRWSVREWITDYDGFYVCCARNALGETCYNDTTNFFFTTDRCLVIPETRGSISDPSGRVDYPLGANVTLQCKYTYLSLSGQPPTWYHFVNGTYHRVHNLPAEYEVYFWHSQITCTYTSQLLIKNLSKQQTGKYICQHTTSALNTTVKLEACAINTEDDYQVQISPLNRTVHFEGSSVTVTCLVSQVDRLHPPNWCRANGTLCTGVEEIDGVFQNLTSFVTSSCTWISQLQIPSFSADTVGDYRCFIPGTNHSDHITLGLILQGAVSGVDVAAVSAGSVVAVLIVSAVISTIVLVIITHRIRTLPYKRAKEPPVNGFKWDVFLSYHNEMEDFVLTHIKMPLEHRQPSYNVCWHHVDFLAGRTILDNINEAVDESRKVVFVFSKSFPQSEYCMAELTRTLDRLQRTRTRCMVPIVLAEEGVPKELKSRVTYWPVVKPEADFIVKLISHLGSPIPQPPQPHTQPCAV